MAAIITNLIILKIKEHFNCDMILRILPYFFNCMRRKLHLLLLLAFDVGSLLAMGIELREQIFCFQLPLTLER